VKRGVQVLRLVVAVTSRLENLSRRRAVRQTWRNSLPSNVLFKFVLSDTTCDIHPMWKLNSESCEVWDVNVPGWTQENIPIVPFALQSLTEGYKPSTGIQFKIKTFGVVIYNIGIVSHLLEINPHTDILLILKNMKTGEVLDNIKFNSSEKSEAEYTFKPVSMKRGLELSPGFDGWLYLGKAGSLNLPSHCLVQDQQHLGKHGIVFFTGLTTVGSTVKKKYTTRHCAPVNIEYALAEPTDTMHHLGARETQNQVETRRQRGIESDVAEESEDQDDLAFIPTLDADFATSTNIKYFIESLQSIDYDYLLVTTDSSIINIDLLLNNLGGYKLFWSSFRHSVKPGDRDLIFEANAFPPLPSQSFVISKQLADFVALNSGYLTDFSSLPVSIGVWMSVLSPEYREDSRWTGGQDVVNRTELWRKGKLIALEGLSSSEMDSVWKD